jgi:hypothetical protein
MFCIAGHAAGEHAHLWLKRRATFQFSVAFRCQLTTENSSGTSCQTYRGTPRATGLQKQFNIVAALRASNWIFLSIWSKLLRVPLSWRNNVCLDPRKRCPLKSKTKENENEGKKKLQENVNKHSASTSHCPTFTWILQPAPKHSKT